MLTTLSVSAQQFNYTGSPQTYTVPAGVTEITVNVFGASGYGNTGQGLGGEITATLVVAAGEILEINVGGQGEVLLGGWNGGGTPGTSTESGGGGGASDIRQNGSTLSNRIIVAGGGGGSNSNCGSFTAAGGNGGGLTAESGCLYSCDDCQYTGEGGTQLAGGIAGPTSHANCTGNQDGQLGIGGSNTANTQGYGAGGGGGYYGGGSGCYEGAGGGSSYSAATSTNIVHTIGVQQGNGMIEIISTNLGVVELEIKATLYPNPTNGKLIIQTDESVSKIEIYSLSGNKLFVFENTNAFNIKELSNGIYLAKIFTEKGMTTKQIIKK